MEAQRCGSANALMSGKPTNQALRISGDNFRLEHIALL